MMAFYWQHVSAAKSHYQAKIAWWWLFTTETCYQNSKKILSICWYTRWAKSRYTVYSIWYSIDGSSQIL